MNNLRTNLTQILQLLCLLLSLPILLTAQTINAKVVGVIDGDTITVLTSSKSQKQVRLIGIDAPEQEQSFSGEARQQLTLLIANKAIAVEQLKIDAAGQIWGKVTRSGKDVGLEMIRLGFAWQSKEYEQGLSEKEKANYLASEKEARRARKGLWQEQSPQSPGSFKQQRPAAAALDSDNVPTQVFNGKIFSGQVAEIIGSTSIAVKKRDNSRIVVCVNNLETPEPGQTYAETARQHLQDLLLNRDVTVSFKGINEVEDCITADVYLDKHNVNLQMIRDGVGWSNKDYFYAEGYYVYEQAEQAARSERRGLWQDSAPVPPWVFRINNPAAYHAEASGSGSSGSSAGQTVHVNGYSRGNGTYVQSYNRSAPGSASSRSSSGGSRGKH